MLLILLFAAFLLRGWIRGFVIPAYVNHFYKEGVDKNFDREFSPLNHKLADYGFTFNHPADVHDECWKGDSVFYQGLGETVPCLKTQSSDQRSFTSSFINQWKRSTPELEQYLLSNGWHKEWNDKQPITEIYNNPSNDASVGVVYSKMDGKTRCEVSIFYNAFSPDLEKTFVNESCTRDVSFFGGQP